MRRIFTAALAACWLSLAACDADDPSGIDPPPQAVVAVEVTPQAQTLPVGTLLQLTATARTSTGGVRSGVTFTWASSDTAVAVVDATGALLARRGGTTQVSATAQGVSGAMLLSVQFPEPWLTSLEPSRATRTAAGLQLAVRGGNFDPATQAYWNGAPRATSRLADGELGVALLPGDLATPGVAQLTVRNPTPGGGLSAPLPFTIEPAVPQLRIDRDTVDLVVGDSLRVRAIARDSLGAARTDAHIIWTRLGPAVALYAYQPYPLSRDSVRIRGAAVGISRVVAETSDGLADTVVVRVRGITQSITKMSAGNALTCGLDATGTAFCWGFVYQQDFTYAPAAVGGGVTFRELTAASSHVCGLTADSRAWCWYGSSPDALGHGGNPSMTPVPVAGGHRFATLSATGWHTCGLDLAGVAWCWGSNAYGQLGDGTTAPRATPVRVASGDVVFASIVTGGYHTCALTPDGETWCWGLNSHGQAGPLVPGCGTCSILPRRIETDLRFVTMAVGGRFNCGLTAAGAAHCWGDGIRGQMGNGGTAGSVAPVPVAGGHVLSSIGAGFGNACGLTSAGTVVCWGQNDYGNNGQPPGPYCIDGNWPYYCNVLPVAVSGGLAFRSLTVGWYHTCAVTTAGVPHCWGENASGELGLGAGGQFVVPTPGQVWDGRRAAATLPFLGSGPAAQPGPRPARHSPTAPGR
jgi:alpha-tubulin suppressor-like RCC1 family protein